MTMHAPHQGHALAWSRAQLAAPSRLGALRLVRRGLWPALLLGALALLILNATRTSRGGGQPVRLAPVTRGPLAVEVLATGTVQPARRVELRYPDESAEVDEVLVEAGEKVAAGQALVRLVAAPLIEDLRRVRSQYLEAGSRLADLRGAPAEARLRALEIGLQRAQKELDYQESRRQQMRELAQAGLVSRADVAQAEHAAAGAELAREEARLALDAQRQRRSSTEESALRAEVGYRGLALERARQALGRATLTASGAGTLLDVPVHAGALLRRGDLVAVLADVSRFRVSAWVDEMEVGRLRVGLPAWIRNEFFGDAELGGTLERIVPNVRNNDRGVPSVEILVALPGAGGEPPAGLTVDVGVRIEQSGDVAQVPLEAVVERGGRPAVFVYDAGRARLVRVRVGLRNDTAVELLDGPPPGTRVLVAGHALLQGGEELRPQDGESSGGLQVEFFR